MLYYLYFTDAGTPKTGLTPTWESLLTAENGTDKSGSAPTISEIGGGWYVFDVTFGTVPWNVATEDLLGVIDGGSVLADADRYKPVAITLRGLALARIAHKGVQDKATGAITIKATDGVRAELRLAMTDAAGQIIRSPEAAS